MERRKALMEVRALVALGAHENMVGYHSSWFENDKLYIQMELCDWSLLMNKLSELFSEADVLEAMHQVKLTKKVTEQIMLLAKEEVGKLGETSSCDVILPYDRAKVLGPLFQTVPVADMSESSLHFS